MDLRLFDGIKTIDWSFLYTLPDSLTFSRASTGTYFDATGTLVSAADNAPRFEYDPVTHEAKGLLLEASATNLAYPSEDFSTSWVSINATETPNVTLAPSGLVTGNSWVRNNPSDDCYTRRQITKDASSLPYCFSIYAKKGTLGRYFAMRLQGTYPNRLDACFDLETGVVVSSSTGGAGFTNTLVKIEPQGDGWYRCIIASSTSDTGTSTSFIVSFNSIASHQADTELDPVLSDGYLWGAQLEAGTFASSYIPTTTAAATRAADSLYTTSIPWFNPAQGTIFIDFTPLNLSNSFAWPLAFTAGDDAGVNSMGFTTSTGGSHWARIRAAASDTTTINFASASAGVRYKDAFAYNASQANAASNGVLGTTDPTVTLPSGINRMRISRSTSAGTTVPGYYRSFKYWNRALSDQELKRITT